MLDDVVLAAFRNELHKVAGYGDLLAKASPYLRNAGALGGVGTLAGGAVGAGVGAARSYRDAKAQGASTASAAASGLGGAATTGLSGAALGGAAGFAGGALAKGSFSGLGQRQGVVGAAARFGERQTHGFAGHLSPAQLEGVRGGAHDARQVLQNAATPQARAAAQTALGAAERAQNVGAYGGATSLPGFAHGLVNKPGETLRAAAGAQWHGGGRGAKALMIGVPAAGAVSTLANPESATGAGKGERVGRELGNVAGNLVPLPLMSGTALGAGLGAVAGRAGRLIDHARGRVQPPAGVAQ